MKATKWILASALLAGTLSTGAFAEEHWNRGRDRDEGTYARRYDRDHDYARNDRYGYNAYRDRDDHDRRNWYRGDRDDHNRRDRDDRGRDRD